MTLPPPDQYLCSPFQQGRGGCGEEGGEQGEEGQEGKHLCLSIAIMQRLAAHNHTNAYNHDLT